MTTVVVYEFCNSPSLALEGWDFENLDARDYYSSRAQALYAALGADVTDEEYALALHVDGRLGLFGLVCEGHAFAVERELVCEVCGDFADYSSELGSDGAPIWGVRDEGGIWGGCGPCGDIHRWVAK